MSSREVIKLNLFEKICATLILCIPYCARPEDRSDEAYAEYELNQTMSRLRLFEPFIKSIREAVILDVGCGMGGFVAGVALKGARKVIGIDIALNRVRVAQKFASVRSIFNAGFVAGDAAYMPFREGQFDFVFSFYTFEHVKQPRWVLKEFWRILKPGGVLAISFPTWYGPWAGHLYALFPVPWLHLIFPERALVYAWKRRYAKLWNNGQIGTGWGPPDSLVNIYSLRDLAHANGISLAEFESLLSLVPVRPIFYEIRCIKGAKWLQKIPFVRELATSSVNVAWQKPDLARWVTK